MYRLEKMKQLDVDASPPANIMTFRPRLGLTDVTSDPDPGDLDPSDPWPKRLPVRSSQQVSNRQPRQTGSQRAMHMSPPCRLHRWAQKLLQGNAITVMSKTLK